MSWLSRQCWFLNISELCRPPRLVAGIDLLLFHIFSASLLFPLSPFCETNYKLQTTHWPRLTNPFTNFPSLPAPSSDIFSCVISSPRYLTPPTDLSFLCGLGETVEALAVGPGRIIKQVPSFLYVTIYCSRAAGKHSSYSGAISWSAVISWGSKRNKNGMGDINHKWGGGKVIKDTINLPSLVANKHDFRFQSEIVLKYVMIKLFFMQIWGTVVSLYACVLIYSWMWPEYYFKDALISLSRWLKFYFFLPRLFPQ
jgi:hypothetical protein